MIHFMVEVYIKHKVQKIWQLRIEGLFFRLRLARIVF